MGIELEPGQSSYEARQQNCTCTWLRGHGVDDVAPELWAEKIIWSDPECVRCSAK